MRWTGLLMSGAMVAGLVTAPAVATAQQRETETVNRTVPLPDNGTVKIRNFSGPVRITAGSGRDVVIKAVRRATRERLDRIKLDITTSGPVVEIEANRRPNGSDRDCRDRDGRNREDDCNNVVETEFDIQVPASAELDVNVFESKITVSGVTGEQRLETFSSDIVVTGARGAMDLKTFSGAIEVDLVGAGAAPDLSAETFSGDIRARLADGAKSSVRFSTFSGNFDSDLALEVRSTGSRGVRGNLRGSSGASTGSGQGPTLRFHTFSGDVRVTK